MESETRVGVASVWEQAMSLGRVAAVPLAVAVTLAGAAESLRAQSSDAPTDVRVQVGPLALSPVIRLTNFGYDSNVYNLDSASKPPERHHGHAESGGRRCCGCITSVAWPRQFDVYGFKG